MPFKGKRPSGETVWPLDVHANETVLCAECEGELGIRDAHYNQGRFVPRHFFHTAGAACGGESALHNKLKTIAAKKLQEVFATATVTIEGQIGDRIADVVATLETPLSPFGHGLIVEIQHKHKDKDIGPITGEYLNAGYSVFWAYQSDFDGDDMIFAEHRTSTVWPDAIPEVDGLTGYPDWVQTFLEPGPPEGVKLTVPIPHQYWQAHALEVVSPSQTREGDELAAPGWEAVETVWLHGKGNEIAWINVLLGPSGDIFIEFWTKNRATNETAFLPARVEATVVSAFEAFLDSARETFRNEEVPSEEDDHDEWVPVASVNFAGTESCEGWLSIAKPPAGPLKVIIGRRDRRGNTRTLAMDYRQGDLSRLAQVRSAITDAVGSQPNPAP